MSDKDEKLTKVGINCEEPIYRKFLKTIENTHFFE